MSIRLKYIDSHWGVFFVQGVIALLFGWFALFTGSSDLQTLILIVGSALLGLGIVELVNLLIRSRLRETWGWSFVMAIFEITAALSLLFTYEQNVAWHLVIIATYTISRGLFEIILGLKSIDDLTDKFSWILAGICGCIMGIVILNAGKTGTLPFIKYFGSYMIILGIVNLIYSVHNREQARDYLFDKQEKKVIKTANSDIKKVSSIKNKTRKTPVTRKRRA